MYKKGGSGFKIEVAEVKKRLFLLIKIITSLSKVVSYWKDGNQFIIYKLKLILT